MRDERIALLALGGREAGMPDLWSSTGCNPVDSSSTTWLHNSREKTMFIWVVTPCELRAEGEDIMFLRKVGIFLLMCTAP
jgi:hypothetical protein